jgi:hypothetical protein
MAKRRRDEEDETPRRKKKTSESSGSTVVTLDFSKDTSDGSRRHFPEGDYRFKVKGIKMGRSEQKGTPFCELTLVFLDKYAGESVRDRLYITEAALWRIRVAFKAAGTEIPKKKTTIDFKKLVGATLGATLTDDEYDDKNGKPKKVSRVGDYIDPEDIDEDADDDEEEDEDEDDEEEDDLEEIDVDEDM